MEWLCFYVLARLEVTLIVVMIYLLLSSYPGLNVNVFARTVVR